MLHSKHKYEIVNSLFRSNQVLIASFCSFKNAKKKNREFENFFSQINIFFFYFVSKKFY